MSERQSCVPKEGTSQVGMATHAGEASVQGAAQGGQVGRAQIRQFARFDIAPHLFDGIQFRSIARQTLDVQPLTLATQVRPHHAAPMRAQSIPDQDDAVAPEVSSQMAQKFDEGPRRVGTGARLEIEAGPAAIPAERQRSRHREPLPGSAGVGQDGRLAARCPRATDDGLLRDAAFVFEDEPGALASGVFFTAGHRAAIQCRMARSSRSRAWRAGRCNDQCSPRRMYQTCPA